MAVNMEGDEDDEDDDLVGRLEMTANNRTPAFTIGIPTQDVN